MNPSERKEVQIFNAALELSTPAERAAYLDRTCAGDEPLRRKVEALLSACGEADDFFQTVAAPPRPVGEQSAPAGTHLLPITEKPGDRIGRYKLLQQIGEGGCGTVYMAEQEEPVRRRVALKVIRLGMDTKTVVARFEAERQALALMDHPNIAKVFDGGATESGRPYFVMELVRGIKITEYCDQAQLTTGERLKLFIQVCQAVQHAHQKGVIHRDIKPSNILVTVNDGVAVPKVIDFGIAKATDQRLTDKSYFTEFHAFIGTPAYTSPEQAEMGSLDIDTRSDIYSLGVLLYEMLTDQTPFPSERLLKSGLDEMRRIIREEEPPRPSTRLTTLGHAEATSLGHKRQAKIPQLVSAVQGDLDWIVMKALEKDRTRRYATSLDFAADLQRHLNNEAVLARPPSQLYRLQRTYRRNRLAFTAAACVFMSMVIALWFIALAAKREGLARVREFIARSAAEQQRQQARADRDRALLAESNATEKATVATNALLTANESLVKLSVAEGWRRVEEGDHFGALLPFAEAFALEQDKPDRAEIHQMRLSSVLQRCPKRVQVWNVGTNIQHAEFSRDGSRLLVALQTTPSRHVAEIWDTASGQRIVGPMIHGPAITRLAWSADESRLVTAGIDGMARIWNARTGESIGPALPHLRPIIQVRFSQDGERLLTAAWGVLGDKIEEHQDLISLWEIRNGRLVWTNRTRLSEVSDFVAFTTDETRAITSREILAIDASTNATALRQLTMHYRMFEGYDSIASELAAKPNAQTVAFSPDGRRLFATPPSVCEYDFSQVTKGAGTLFDGQSLDRTIAELTTPGMPYAGVLSPDSRWLATANRGNIIQIWAAEDGRAASPRLSLDHDANCLAFSASGRQLGVGCKDGTARVWDVANGRAIAPPLPHSSALLRIRFGPGENELSSVCADGTIRRWSLMRGLIPRFAWQVGAIEGFDHINGSVITAGPINDHVMVWNLTNGLPLLPPVKDVRLANSNYRPEWRLYRQSIVDTVPSWLSGPLFLISNTVDTATAVRRAINLSTGQISTNQVLLSVPPAQVRITIGDVTPRLLAYDGHTNAGTISVFDMVSGRPLAHLTTEAPIRSANFAAFDQHVVALQTNGAEISWDIASGQVISRFNPPKAARSWFAGPSTNETGLRQAEGGSIEIRDTTTGLHIDTASVYGVSNDKNTIATASDSGTVRLHSVTGSSAPLELFHRKAIGELHFSPDDNFLLTLDKASTVRLWSTTTGEPISILNLGYEANSIKWSPDSRGFWSISGDSMISQTFVMRFWAIRPEPWSPSDWRELARLMANKGLRSRNHNLDADTSRKPSTANTANDRWAALYARIPAGFTVSADEIDAWHRHEAWRCESTKDWSNAVHHLTVLLKTQPDSGDFLPRRAAAYVAWATELVAAAAGETVGRGESEKVSQNTTAKAGSPPPTFPSAPLVVPHWEHALADYTRTLAWVDRYPAIAKESRLPFVEKRREVYLKLARKPEADADERELKAAGR